MKVLFSAGLVVETAGVQELAERCKIDKLELIRRHTCGDWGCVSDVQARANHGAVGTGGGGRVLSKYGVAAGEYIYLVTDITITEHITTLFTPSEARDAWF